MTAIHPAPMALSVTGVTKRYTSGFTLEDVTLDLPMGYIMGLIGPNGAGKSTLIKLILNMVRRDAGSIEVLGLDAIAHEEDVKRNIGVVFDSSYFVETWTVGKVGRVMRGFHESWDDAAFAGHLRRFGLDPARKVRELSRGMQMKLMLAVALSHDARLLILDEPTSGLDVIARDELMDLLAAYIEPCDRSVLFSTHITADLERSADFLTYITGGRVYYTGPRDEFEEAFHLVKGGPSELTGALAGVAVGLRRYETGFDALVCTEDLPRLGITTDGAVREVGGAAGNVPRLAVEPASIDDVILLTNADDPESPAGWEV